jgi:endoglucanase
MSRAPALSAAERQRLRDLLACPTAPYREAAVKGWATARLAAAGVPSCEDRHGNLIVGCATLADYRALLRRRAAGPLALLVAHMDHPGFHGVRWLAPDRLAVRWHGGGPRRHLQRARVWLTFDGRAEFSGRLQQPVLSRDGHALARAEVALDAPLPGRRPAARRLYGGLAFKAPTWRAGHRLYGRVADDLTGVFAIVETACASHRHAPPGQALVGLLTRAEEVGFIGLLAHLDDGWLQRARRPLLGISLEASRNVPGARPGHGPVVRFGDRQGPFSAHGSRLLDRLAAELLPGRYQRKLMDGGSCEATALLVHGVPAAGLALPLGNYHNQNFDGGQEATAADGPAPEFVDLRDLAGLLVLCRALATRPWPEDPWAPLRQHLARRLRAARRMLEAG